MERRKLLLDEDDEDGGYEEIDSKTSSLSSDEESTSETSIESAAEVAFLTLEKEDLNEANINKLDEEMDMPGSYEQIEELMQPKMEAKEKQGVLEKMLGLDLVSQEKSEYLHMLSLFPNLFNTSYEEIRGFHGEDLHISLYEGVQPI